MAAPSLAQHADQHRPQRPVLLAVDQELGEVASVGSRFGMPLSHEATFLAVGA
jgi:hypothetical protein